MASGDRVNARVGQAQIEIIQPDLRRLADQITSGAVESFIRAARRQTDPIVSEGKSQRSLWPIRTGRSIGATRIRETVTRDEVAVTVLSEEPYTYKIRYSVRTAKEMDRSAALRASAIWSAVGVGVSRGKTPQTRAKIGRRLIALFTRKTYDRALWWPLNRGEPTERGIADYQRSRWTKSHGAGAPSEALAGRNVWSTRIRKPMKRAEKKLIDEAGAALAKLAGG